MFFVKTLQGGEQGGVEFAPAGLIEQSWAQSGPDHQYALRQPPAFVRAVELAFQAVRVDAVGGAGEQRRQCPLQAWLVQRSQLLQSRDAAAIARWCVRVEHAAAAEGALGGLIAQDDTVAMHGVARCIQQ